MPLTLEDARSQGLVPWQDLVCDLGTVKVYADRYPVTAGHALFVPAEDTEAGVAECLHQAYRLGQHMIDTGACDGFNIGMNRGTAAGQTVMYPHVHFIPRHIGDCADPVGGVRGVIPGQANYKKPGYQQP